MLFKLLEDSHSITTYDLKELVKRLNWIIQIKSGKAKHLRYQFAQISDHTRQRLIELCANLLREDFVPINKYNDLEKNNIELKSKYTDLEHKYQDMMDEFTEKLEQLEMEIRNQVVPRKKYELERPRDRNIIRLSER